MIYDNQHLLFPSWSIIHNIDYATRYDKQNGTGSSVEMVKKRPAVVWPPSNVLLGILASPGVPEANVSFPAVPSVPVVQSMGSCLMSRESSPQRRRQGVPSVSGVPPGPANINGWPLTVIRNRSPIDKVDTVDIVDRHLFPVHSAAPSTPVSRLCCGLQAHSTVGACVCLGFSFAGSCAAAGCKPTARLAPACAWVFRLRGHVPLRDQATAKRRKRCRRDAYQPRASAQRRDASRSPQRRSTSPLGPMCHSLRSRRPSCPIHGIMPYES
jgi:hypothetical protein